MSNFEQLADLLAGLKGAPASVLWALSLAGRPLSTGELLTLTGYSAKPVRRAVRELLARGIITRDGPRVYALAGNWAHVAAKTTGCQQPHTSSEPAAAARESAGRGHPNRKSGRIDHESGPASPPGDHVVVADDRHLDRPYQQQQQGPRRRIPAGAQKLAAVLARLGVNGRLYWELLQREDLAARPEAALAWWWYFRTQQGVRNPTGATITRLLSRDEPPEGYLALAQLWPHLDDELRYELASLVIHSWTAEQIAASLAADCPGLTAGAVAAYMTLGAEELEAGEDVGV